MSDTEPSEFDRERLQSLDQRELELLRATNSFQQAAVRPLILLNGGATVAVLTLLGHVMTQEPAYGSIDGNSIKLALLCWAAGLVSALCSSVIGYFTSESVFEHAQAIRMAIEYRLWGREDAFETQIKLIEKLKKSGLRRRLWSHIFGAASVLVFLAGVGVAARALRF